MLNLPKPTYHENEFAVFGNFNSDERTEALYQNKEFNMRYWDTIELHVEKLIKQVAIEGGIDIIEVNEFTFIKELTELITDKMTEQFGASYPVIEDDE